jgi:cephalosporin hydroxylase
MVVEEFHSMYYGSNVWQRTYWLGYQVLKCPLDCWIYQELIYAHRPDVIIECGTWRGGSALFFASICTLLNHGRVITIDRLSEEEIGQRPEQSLIKYVYGSSTDPNVYQSLRHMLGENESVMAVFDSDHTPVHVARELELYSQLVTPGQAMVVEDTNAALVGGSSDWDLLPVIDAFLKKHPNFQYHEDCEKFFMTFNPGGWLQRKP